MSVIVENLAQHIYHNEKEDISKIEKERNISGDQSW
jgi:hypothetical protein